MEPLSKEDQDFINESIKNAETKPILDEPIDETFDENSFMGEWYDQLDRNRKGVKNMAEDKVYDASNLPEDAEVITSQSAEFEPIDPSETYTVEVLKADLRDNPFYKPEEKDPQKRGNKYNLNFELAILDDGEFYGRRIWDTTSLVMKPSGKKGATKLYKIVTAAIRTELDWDGCAAFAPDIKVLYKHLQEDVIGHQLKVAIENIVNPDTKKTRTKVASYNPVKEGKELPKFDAEKAKAIGEVKKAEAAEKAKAKEV